MRSQDGLRLLRGFQPEGFVVLPVDHMDSQAPVVLSVVGLQLAVPKRDEQAGRAEEVAFPSGGELSVLLDVVAMQDFDAVELLAELLGELGAVVERIGEGEEDIPERVAGLAGPNP
ncbi:hypothetical protein [Streptomyces sp. NPDC055036]